jgi:hypothetical protein
MAGTSAVSTAPMVPQIVQLFPSRMRSKARPSGFDGTCRPPKRTPAITITRIVPSSSKSAAPGSRRPAHAQIIDCRHHDHDQRRKRLSGGEGEVVTCRDVRGTKAWRRWEKGIRRIARIPRPECHGDRAFEKRTHPAKKKSPERTETAAEVDVRAAGLGECRAQFGVAEGAAKHDEAAGDPRHKTSVAEPTARAMSLVTRKTPVPMVSPMTIAVADHRPKPRTKSGRSADCSSNGLLRSARWDLAHNKVQRDYSAR